MVGTRSWEDGFFAQDDWRVTPRLTLNLGIRYDIMTWPTEVEESPSQFRHNHRRIDRRRQQWRAAHSSS